MSEGPPPLTYVGLAELGGRPHVMLDGAPREGSVLTLSHWPSTPSPADLARDTSTEIALAYLDETEHWVGDTVALATLDHLDEDGLLALWCLLDPPAARARAERCSAAARAGDFEVLDGPEAGQVAWALRHLLDPERSPFTAPAAAVQLAAGRSGAASAWGASAVRCALDRVPELLDRPGRHQAWWGEEAAAYRAAEQAVEVGRVELRSLGRADLAVVVAEGPGERSSFARIGDHGLLPVHPAAIHSRIAETRILVVNGRRYCYYDRYESWVRYRSRAVPLRRDLAPLAARLSAEEAGGALWVADPPGQAVPVLRLAEGAESTLRAEAVLALLVDHLEQAPPAWSPSRPNGALVPAREVAAERRREAGLSGPATPRGGTSGRGRARWRGRRGGALSR